MDQKWHTHLFQYHHNGSVWSFEVVAHSEQDARERLERLQNAEYLGVQQMKIPVELGVFARLICWWQNLRAKA